MTLRPALFLVILAALPFAARASSATMANLQAAYQADMNAHARYAAFAEKAQGEGYRQVARIFRAAARSEQIRGDNHAAVIRRLGGDPSADVQPPVVKSTRENLLWTMAHENAERTTSYPRFAQQARRDGNSDALLSFTLARATEREVVKLYQEAFGNLERMREAGDALYVCETCGYVSRRQAPDECPVSMSSREAFVRID
jgi:rubrerythrin